MIIVAPNIIRVFFSSSSLCYILTPTFMIIKTIIVIITIDIVITIIIMNTLVIIVNISHNNIAHSLTLSAKGRVGLMTAPATMRLGAHHSCHLCYHLCHFLSSLAYHI
jgi:hypothetical protein